MENKVKWYGYVALAFIILFFSGVFSDATGPLRALDFDNILGAFGSLGTLEEGAGTLAANFRGVGGNGARDGFLFALTLVPAVLLALGVVKMVEHLDGLKAASKLMNPILKPLLGIPGIGGIGLIASLQSADAGASMIKELADENYINEKERLIFTAFQFSAGGMLTNFLGSGAALFPYLAEVNVPILVPMVVMLVFKFVGANLMRLYLNVFAKEVM